MLIEWFEEIVYVLKPERTHSGGGSGGGDHPVAALIGALLGVAIVLGAAALIVKLVF